MSFPVFLYVPWQGFLRGKSGHLVVLKGDYMTLDEVIFELYRLAETKTWDGKITDEALSAAIEGMEQIWELRQADKRRVAMVNANKKQPRLMC
jgi:hypothetical protein